MNREPTKLRLDPAPARAMGKAVQILSRWLPIRHLRLGGGTALAARWHHRSGTDLDFFYSHGGVSPESLFLKDFDGIRMDLHRLAVATAHRCPTRPDSPKPVETHASDDGNRTRLRPAARQPHSRHRPSERQT